MNSTNNKNIEDLNFAQKQRLAFLDFLLMFRGTFNRSDLTSKFQMGMANATRDIALYRNLAPKNFNFDKKGFRAKGPPSSKTYCKCQMPKKTVILYIKSCTDPVF